MADLPGNYQGRHFTAYIEKVKALKRSGDNVALEQLLLHLIDADESESRARRWPVAPWYYEELAILYRKRADYHAELAVVERFKQQYHADNPSSLDVLKREEYIRHKLSGL